ncbi:hydroxyacylglutathione hydrolase [Cognatilysobacter lacus]|uniref:Hydroxyacylglutathione hydrolase n=1 Tax=Cognatilysobacter lacus TaxID=1643323 RepID=A0A5D8ZA45_9GAMM|nr:hydroxyacylglutathione hydrolase [Lysobacter lacus]TZF91709.1 hydroxyacylglutathione hydrolase [Lysobacter lacus]
MRLQPLSARVDNYIWVLRNSKGRALVVDPGEAGPVLQAANADAFVPAAILLTHHHDDHVAGAASLLERWHDTPVYGPDDDRVGLHMHRPADGEAFHIDDWSIRVMHVPGHTRTHIAFYVEDAGNDPVLFCGDTLFSLGCGRLFEGDASEMENSLGRLAALPPATRVCCGHEYTLANAAFAVVVEPDNAALRRRMKEAKTMRDARQPTLPTTIGSELACNPFLRCDQPAVVDAASRRLGRAPAGRVETFATLRAWKDGFAA